jgi:hypothetical protein
MGITFLSFEAQTALPLRIQYYSTGPDEVFDTLTLSGDQIDSTLSDSDIDAIIAIVDAAIIAVNPNTQIQRRINYYYNNSLATSSAYVEIQAAP